MRKLVVQIVSLLLLLGAGPAVTTDYRGVLSAGNNGLIVIRNAKDFDAFVDRIPREQITPTNPAPPSDDPLLGHPAIDFSRSTVIVAYSDSMLTNVTIDKLEPDHGKLVVRVRRVASREMASVPLGVGRYHCVVIDRWDGPIAEPGR